MVEQNASDLANQFNATINWEQLQSSLEQQLHFPSHIKTASAMQSFYRKQSDSKLMKELATKILQEQQQVIEEEIQNIDNEIYDLDYALAKRFSKTNEKKKISKQNKKEKLMQKLVSSKNIGSWDSHFIFPHWKLFAVIKNKKSGNLEVSDFEYGHFRDTGVFLEDLLYHLGKHPKSPQYSLYNSKIESLSREYFDQTQEQLKSISKKRRENAKLLLNDFKKEKGIFNEVLQEKINNFMDCYQWDPAQIEQIEPIHQSYMQDLFPQNKAIVKASAFREMVLESDYFKNKDASSKHIAVDFYQDEEVYFPAMYSEYGKTGQKLRGLSIITTEPRLEVLEKGHDRSPICLSKEGAKAYLEESLSHEEYFELFEHYSVPSPFQSKLVGA